MVSTKAVNLRKEKYDVYIGRAGHGLDGTFGNPVRAGFPCPICSDVHAEGGGTLDCYRSYLLNRVSTDAVFRAKVLQLRGLKLGCFCKPKRCHGDILSAWIDSQPQVENE